MGFRTNKEPKVNTTSILKTNSHNKAVDKADSKVAEINRTNEISQIIKISKTNKTHSNNQIKVKGPTKGARAKIKIKTSSSKIRTTVVVLVVEAINKVEETDNPKIHNKEVINKEAKTQEEVSKEGEEEEVAIEPLLSSIEPICAYHRKTTM